MSKFQDPGNVPVQCLHVPHSCFHKSMSNGQKGAMSLKSDGWTTGNAPAKQLPTTSAVSLEGESQ